MPMLAEKSLSINHNAGYNLLQPNPDRIDAAKKATGCIDAFLQDTDFVQRPSRCRKEHNCESLGSEAGVPNY